MSLPQAVALLFRCEDGRILAVSRRHDPTKFGLPGGKVDADEILEEALHREVLEEVGLILGEADPQDLVEVYRAVCPGEVTYESIIYVYTSAVAPESYFFPEEGLTVAWVDQATLIAGPFGEFNRQLFAQYLTTPHPDEYLASLDEVAHIPLTPVDAAKPMKLCR